MCRRGSHNDVRIDERLLSVLAVTEWKNIPFRGHARSEFFSFAAFLELCRSCHAAPGQVAVRLAGGGFGSAHGNATTKSHDSLFGFYRVTKVEF